MQSGFRAGKSFGLQFSVEEIASERERDRASDLDDIYVKCKFYDSIRWVCSLHDLRVSIKAPVWRLIIVWHIRNAFWSDKITWNYVTLGGKYFLIKLVARPALLMHIKFHHHFYFSHARYINCIFSRAQTASWLNVIKTDARIYRLAETERKPPLPLRRVLKTINRAVTLSSRQTRWASFLMSVTENE